MTRSTFTERLHACERRARRFYVAACLLVLLGFVGGIGLADVLVQPWLAKTEGPREQKARALTYSTVVCAVNLSIGLLALALARWGSRWSVRTSGLACPSCGASLVRTRYAALGAGTCCHCRTRVVEDAPPAGVTLPTRDEFRIRQEEYRVAWQAWDPKLLGVGLCFLAGFLLTWPVAIVEPFVRPTGLGGLVLLWLMVGLGGPFVVYLRYLGRWERQLRKIHGLTCGWCGAGLTGRRGRITADTGRCDACGQPAFRDAGPVLLTEPLGTS